MKEERKKQLEELYAAKVQAKAEEISNGYTNIPKMVIRNFCQVPIFVNS